MLHDRILELKLEVSSITNNPVLDAFNLIECKYLDSQYSANNFIKSKVDSCLIHLKNLKTDFNPSYRSAYEEYNEAMVYVDLSKKHTTIKIPEAKIPTPDFRLTDNSEFLFDIYVEVKALSFLERNLNYIEAQKSGLEANIAIEEQINNGKHIAFGEALISPFLKTPSYPLQSN
jgi:hypothetical protein